MNLNNTFRSAWSRWTAFVVIFVVSIVLTFWIRPQTEVFNRYFEIGKPWSYDLLTAPCDFAIFKSGEQLKAEQDSALRGLEPYMILDQSVASAEATRFATTVAPRLSQREIQWFQEQIDHIYDQGLMSRADMNHLSRRHISNITVVNNNMAQTRGLSTVHTVGSAYQYLLNQAEKVAFINSESLKDNNIESYIKPNLSLDTRKTAQAEEEILSTVSPTAGMVQKGERIIDKGEVVTKESYQILASLKKLNGDDLMESRSPIWGNIGNIALIIIVYLLPMSYFYFFRSSILQSVRELLFMYIMSVGSLLLLYAAHCMGFSEYLVPFAMLPLIIRVFFDSRTALFVHITTVLLAAQMVSNPMEFTLMQFTAGFVAIASLRMMESRAQLVRSAIYVFLAYSIVYTSLELSHNNAITQINYLTYIVFFLNALSLLFAYVLIFIIEKLFGFLSSITLVELSNINTPLLLEFSEKCPGTFQHVLQVSNLAVEVAKKIGANPLLVRTGAIYHDIGKMANPMLYTENQVAGMNPLDALPYEEAAQIIISHVGEGLKIAQKEGLPHQVMEFISSHHGKSKVKYFYNSFKNKYPDREIDESLFTYPGPLPNTKEKAILMMSDVVEAASRSLKSYSADEINNMVDGVINSQITDGQFRNAPISFADVEQARQVFKEKLRNIYHERISYPALNKNK